MATIEEILTNVKNNMTYFINSDDTFDVVIDKIIQKLGENGVTIKNKGYEIIDFKENFSKVAFKIKIQTTEENIEENIIILMQNNDFISSVVKNYKKAVVLYLINSLELRVDKFAQPVPADEGITRNQTAFLRDKMEDEEVESLVRTELKKYKVSSINDLTKKQASAILDIIQPRSKKKSSRY